MSWRPLLPDEDPETTSAATAHRWSSIYQDLVVVTERRLARSTELRDAAQSATSAQKSIAERLEGARAGIDFWRQRAWDLQGIGLDHERRLLSHRGNTVKLTPRELQLLRLLMATANRPVPFRAFMEEVWSDSIVTRGALRVCIARLRAKLAAVNLADISTMPGGSYILIYRG